MSKTAVEICNDIAFDGIESASETIIREAGRIDGYAHEIARRYPFRTRLESGLDNAEAALLAALNSVRLARTSYQQAAE